MKTVAGIDLGTQSMKVVIYDYEKKEIIEKDKELLEDISTKETKLLKLNNLLNKLNGIKDDYVEQTLGDNYLTEITNVSEQFEELEEVQKPKQKIKK